MAPFVRGQFVYADQLNASLAAKLDAGTVSSYSATLLTGATQAAWFASLGLPAAAPGSANGLATLNSSGVVPNAQISPAIVGALYPKGGWNANTNNPALASGVGSKGDFYVVTVAGATNLDGNGVWSVNDCLFFDGTIWRKINASGNVTIPASNINDSTTAGRAILTSPTVAAQRATLLIDQAQLVVDSTQTITAAMSAVVWTSLTAPRVCSLPAASSFTQGQYVRVYDESGNCSATNTITLAVNGSDTINGAASYILNKPYAAVEISKASPTKWTVLPFLPYVPTWITQPISVRQTVIGGPADVNGLPNFLPATSGSLSITSQNISSATPLVATSASGSSVTGQSDLTGLSTTNITWAGLTANQTNYLGVYVGTDGSLAPFSTVAPIYQQGGTPSTVNGVFTFNIGEMILYLGNGTTSARSSAVFVGQVVAGASTITSTVAYGYRGIYDGAYIATLPGSGLTAISHNLGIIPNTCNVFFKNTTAEFGYSIGDVVVAVAGATLVNSAEFVLTLSATTASMTVNSNTIGLLNKTTGAGVNLTSANWAYKIRATRNW